MSRSFDCERRLSSSKKLDIWEHACLLYHNFEWQSAADTFLTLEQNVSDPHDKTIFALNRGLIEARLGDFDSAAVTWEHALVLDEENPIIHFLLGLVNFELRNHPKGYHHFEASLQRLPEHGLDCRADGLSYNLSAFAVKENLERLETVLSMEITGLHDYASMQICLNSIPAELVFEAPSRTSKLSQLASSLGETEQTESEKAREKGSTTDSSQYQEKLGTAEYRPPVPRKASTLSPEQHDPKLETIDLPPLGKTTDPVAAQDSNIPPAVAKLSATLSPRHPQLRQESTRELARFIRHAGPSGEKNVTVDREYMLRLLQNKNATPAGSKIYETVTHAVGSEERHALSVDEHVDLENLIDLYAQSISKGNPASEASRPPIVKEDPRRREQEGYLTPNESLPASKTPSGPGIPMPKRKPLPCVDPTASSPENPGRQLPEVISNDDPLKRSKPRRLALKAAQRWLRKEVHPPWSRKHAAKEQNIPEVAEDGSLRSGHSSSENEKAIESPPSTMSSTEFFGRGRKEKSMSIKQALWESGLV